MNLSYNEIITLLSSGEQEIEFTKADGTKRKMKCTRDPSLIPKADAPKTVAESQKPVNQKSVTVYELGVGWRSFRTESLLTINVDLVNKAILKEIDLMRA